MKPGRTPCINPRCNRTADRAKFPDEMICAKCFKSLPAEIKADYRNAWRQYNLHCRRISRTSDELKLKKLHAKQGFWAMACDRAWWRIRDHVITPDKPEGLDNFMQDIGIC